MRLLANTLAIITLWHSVASFSTAPPQAIVRPLSRKLLVRTCSQARRRPDDPKASSPPRFQEIKSEDFFHNLKPGGFWQLASSNFVRNWNTLTEQIQKHVGWASRSDPLQPPDSLQVHLLNEAVLETELHRIAAGGTKVQAHPVSQALYDWGCVILDRMFDKRPIERFWFLETIARIPYFSYVCMLHFYETLGWWRAVELRKVHNAEEWNELHHLLIMESLGGNRLWSDRFLGYHVAILYYWALVLVFMGSPRIAYEFMELIEHHAADTYMTFLRSNEQRLRELPAPEGKSRQLNEEEESG